MNIRSYTSSDRSEIIKLWKGTLFDVFKNDPNINEQTVEDISETYVNNFLVAEVEGHIVGTIGFLIEDDNARLKRMYVDKNYQGKGIANKLYEEIEKRIKKLKLHKIILSTYPQMERAVTFYKKKGFHELEKKGEQLYMIKDLGFDNPPSDNKK